LSTLVATLPNSILRDHVTLFVSTDGAKTWHSPTVLSLGSSAYSSLALLPSSSTAGGLYHVAAAWEANNYQDILFAVLAVPVTTSAQGV
jgi:hypothetical protein